MLKVCLSHDIDRTQKSYQYITKSVYSLMNFNFQGILNQAISLMHRNQFWTFNKFIEIEKSYNIRSTVFFLNETIKLKILNPKTYQLALGRYNINDKRIVQIIKWLDDNGWEIGVHGSYNSYNNYTLLKMEKDTLENILGHSVIGIRQHYLNLNEHTWTLQQKAGFMYDSSWGYTNGVGFLENMYNPFYPLGNGFKVIPLVLMDNCFMSLPDKWSVYEDLLGFCEENNAVMVVNFHQHVFNQYDFPGYEKAYIEIIERAKRRNAIFLTLSEI